MCQRKFGPRRLYCCLFSLWRNLWSTPSGSNILIVCLTVSLQTTNPCSTTSRCHMDRYPTFRPLYLSSGSIWLITEERPVRFFLLVWPFWDNIRLSCLELRLTSWISRRQEKSFFLLITETKLMFYKVVSWLTTVIHLGYRCAMRMTHRKCRHNFQGNLDMSTYMSTSFEKARYMSS
jgi:hypothetical protein